MTLGADPEAVSSAKAEQDSGHHLGIALLVLASAQLMVVLDGTITNIALPSIQKDLDVSPTGLAWVVTSYALAFGGLLLLGGRAGDLFGRRRMFWIGVTVFTVASLLGGFAPNIGLLVAARVVQGIGGAIVAPAALSLIATMFPEGRPRNRAMGVYAAMAGLGSTIGLLLGGVLTDYLSWRWVLFVNVPIGVVVLVGTRVLTGGERGHGRLDVPGAVTGTAGMVCLVYAITRGGGDGWADALTIASFVAAAILMAVFLAIQARIGHPMMPLRLFKDRNRAGSYTTMLLIGSGMFATFYFLTLYLQQVLGYSPVKTGIAYLPFSFGMGVSAGFGSRLAGRLAPRVIAGPGLIITTAGMFWFSQISPTSSYAGQLMPAMFVTSVGLGLSFLPMTLGAVSGVTDRDAGIASALLNTAQQIGGALGLAVLTTISTTAADDRLPGADRALFKGISTHDLGLVRRAADALTHGYATAFASTCVLFIVALVVTLTAINAKRQQQRPGNDAAVPM